MNTSRHIINNRYENPNAHYEMVNVGNKSTPIRVKSAITSLMGLRENKS